MKTAGAYNAGLLSLTGNVETENPLSLPEVHLEFGRMLMRHIDTFTNEERNRYEELKRFLSVTKRLMKMGEDKDAEIAALKSRITELEKQLQFGTPTDGEAQ